jgi:hypothetical protein
VSLDHAAGIAGTVGKGGEVVVSLIAQHHAVGQKQHAPGPLLVQPVQPARPGQLPRDLKGDERLAGACSHRQEDPPLAAHHTSYHLANGRFLEVKGLLPALAPGAVGVQQRVPVAIGGKGHGGIVDGPVSLGAAWHRAGRPQSCVLLPALPEMAGGGELPQVAAAVGEKVVLDSAMPIGRVGKRQAEILGVPFGLFQSPVGRVAFIFGLDDGNGEGIGVAQQIVHPARLSPSGLVTDEVDAARGVAVIAPVKVLAGDQAVRPASRL